MAPVAAGVDDDDGLWEEEDNDELGAPTGAPIGAPIGAPTGAPAALVSTPPGEKPGMDEDTGQAQQRKRAREEEQEGSPTGGDDDEELNSDDDSEGTPSIHSFKRVRADSAEFFFLASADQP